MTEMCTYFITKTDVAQNLIDDFFTGLISEKRKLCMRNLTKERKQPQCILYNIFILYL